MNNYTSFSAPKLFHKEEIGSIIIVIQYGR